MKELLLSQVVVSVLGIHAILVAGSVSSCLSGELAKRAKLLGNLLVFLLHRGKCFYLPVELVKLTVVNH